MIFIEERIKSFEWLLFSPAVRSCLFEVIHRWHHRFVSTWISENVSKPNCSWGGKGSGSSFPPGLQSTCLGHQPQAHSRAYSQASMWPFTLAGLGAPLNSWQTAALQGYFQRLWLHFGPQPEGEVRLNLCNLSSASFRVFPCEVRIRLLWRSNAISKEGVHEPWMSSTGSKDHKKVKWNFGCIYFSFCLSILSKFFIMTSFIICFFF